MLSKKRITNEKIILFENGKILSNDNEMAEVSIFSSQEL